MLIRVLELPKSFPPGFRFGGGAPVTFIEVDWFRDDPGIGAPDFGTVEGREVVTQFVKAKRYYDPDKSYLVLHPQHPLTINYQAP